METNGKIDEACGIPLFDDAQRALRRFSLQPEHAAISKRNGSIVIDKIENIVPLGGAQLDPVAMLLSAPCSSTVSKRYCTAE